MTNFVHLVEGSVFAGVFRVLRPLGAGATGAVYAAQHETTGQTLALKVLPPDLVRDARTRERFLEQATVGARIESDHLVQVIAVGIDAETRTPWIAMELLEGADLAAILAEPEPLPPGEARQIFVQLCHAVDAAHRAGVVHRDLTPQNVFLDARLSEGAPFTVKLLGLGLAEMVADAGAARAHALGRQVSTTIGSPSSMAPEQLEAGASVTPATDVWALGLIAFTLLTGRGFWRWAQAPDPGGVRLLREVILDPIPTASERAAELGCVHLLPAGFDAWFARCVAREPEARFRRAGDARVMLEAVLEPPRQAGPGPRRTPSERRLAKVSWKPPPDPALAAALHVPRAAARILVVDDNPADQLVLRHHLTQAGYAVASADSGEEAVARARRDVPSLIVLDFMLPDIDAPEVLRRLRSDDATREVPVILLTATDLAADIAAGFQAGANDYLMKPVDLARLSGRIEAALHARELARRGSDAGVIEHRHGRLVAELEEARAEQEEPLSVLPASWAGWWAVGGVAQSGLVGGDLIAIYEGVGGERTAVVVDVSGHGAGAALVGASVRAALAFILRHHGPAEALAALNDELCHAAAPRHACIAIVQVRGAEVIAVNAGLPPVYVARRGRVMREIVSCGVPPGLLPEQVYAAESFTVEPGDRIAVVSDGLVEPFGLADDGLPVLRELGVFDARRWMGGERPVEVAELLRRKLSGVAAVQPDDATLLLMPAG